MSAPTYIKTVQEAADFSGASRRLMFPAISVRRYGCSEVVKAVPGEGPAEC